MAKKYRTRKQFFQQAASFNARFLEELAYARRTFEEFCAKTQLYGEFHEMIQMENLRRNERKTTQDDFSQYGFLSADEKTFFKDYFSAIGRGDSQSQKAYFSRAGNCLEAWKNQAIEECSKRFDMYTKLGFLSGLAALIFLV